MAVEKNCVFVTAAQLNRGAVEEVEFDHSHISGGLSKIQTADNVFGIFTSRAMRERGRYQIQLMKTRSSSGVGMKIDLAYDIDTLRITDLEEEQGYGNASTMSAGSALIHSIKNRNTVEGAAPSAKVTAGIQSTALRDLINNLDVDVDEF